MVEVFDSLAIFLYSLLVNTGTIAIPYGHGWVFMLLSVCKGYSEAFSTFFEGLLVLLDYVAIVTGKQIGRAHV